jgi:hypothetical protein
MLAAAQADDSDLLAMLGEFLYPAMKKAEDRIIAVERLGCNK